MTLPVRKPKPKLHENKRKFPGHRAWVRKHMCVVTTVLPRGGNGILECDGDTECAHVRMGTDGGVGIKPSDWWTVSLCRAHHAQQHQIGEGPFEKRYCLDLKKLAKEFARKSPHYPKMKEAMK